jgi:predicted MPP superfamily phosphohydrolase
MPCRHRERVQLGGPGPVRRPRNHNADDRSEVRGRARWLLWLGAAAALAASVAVAIGLREAVADPDIRRVAVALPGWPANQRSVSIALLADIHLGNRAMDIRRLSAVVDQVNGARPDLVLVAGDFLAGYDGQGAAERAAAVQKPLARLNPPMGVIAVLGHHDHWTGPQSITAALTNAGVTLLTNSAIRRGPLAIIGVDDVFSGHPDLGAALASWNGIGGIPVFLTHSPDLVHRLRADVPLVLAGHTHCGQVVIPWVRRQVLGSPRQRWRPLYDPRYRCGII